MAKTYRVGIIGATGRGDYGHGLDVAWAEIPQAEVVAVADSDANGRAAAAERSGAKNAYADYREMLEKEKLDIVTVATRWIDQHHDMIVAALEHGCHVYMEKPFCRTLEEADDIVRNCEMRHLKLAIAYTNRYSPTRAFIKDLIAQGEIGDLMEFRARGKEDPNRGGGEDLWVLGTHMLDMMRSFGGDPQSCFARVMQKGEPVTAAHVGEGNEGIGPLAGDAIDAMYFFDRGVRGHFSSHRGRGGEPTRFGIRIHGTKGVIEMPSGFAQTAYLLKTSSWSPGQSGVNWVPISSEGIGTKGSPGTLHNGNIAAITDLIEAIEHDRQPMSNVYDARAATEMIVAVFESHRQGGPVTFPLENRKNPLTML